MSRRLPFLGFIAVTLLTVGSLTGCGTGRSTGKATFGVGTPASSWSREVKFSVDGAGHIVSERTAATITFSEGKLVVEKARVLLNEQELAKLAEDAKVVEVDYAGGNLTIKADGTKVHEAKLRK